MRRFFWVSLRKLLLLMTLCCLGLAYWSTQVQPYRDQHAAMRMVIENGG